MENMHAREGEVSFRSCLSRFSVPTLNRFFAATELKAMLAYLLINYDIKAENEGVRPPDYSFGRVRQPSPTAKIWVRRRQ